MLPERVAMDMKVARSLEVWLRARQVRGTGVPFRDGAHSKEEGIWENRLLQAKYDSVSSFDNVENLRHLVG